tara:strand:- start:33 stop:467 length:435 start_codon:yes stop_codon:yes gene_type:complete
MEKSKDKNVVIDFIKKEEEDLVEFFSSFQIISLTIASIIGISMASVSKSFTTDIVMPIIEPLFSENWKTYSILIGDIKLNIGLFMSEVLYLLIIVLIMFIVYSFFKNYLGKIIEKRNEAYYLQKDMIKELKEIKEELKNKKKPF